MAAKTRDMGLVLEDQTKGLMDLIFPDNLEGTARQGENPILSFDVFAMGVKGCIEENEYVYTPSGVKQIKDVKDGQSILGGHVKGLHKFQSDILELTFQNHISLRVSPEHPFFIRKNSFDKKGFWIPARDIPEVMVTHNPYVQFYLPSNFMVETITVGESFAELLGYLLSDGYFAENQSVKFTNTNSLHLNRVKELAEEFGLTTKMYRKGKGYDLMLYTYKHGENKGYVRFERSWLLDRLRVLKVINRDTLGSIQQLPVNELQKFIKGFFAGDGCLVITNSDRFKGVTIYFFTGLRRNIAVELQYILWRLGIVSTIYNEHKPKSGYRVCVARAQSCEKLLSMIENKYRDDRITKAYQTIEQIKRKLVFMDDSYWISLSHIKNIGTGTVVGWETDPSGEIITYCGMRTHNSGKTEFAYRLGEWAVDKYGVEMVNAVQTSMRGLYTGFNNAPIQIQFVDDATFIKPPKDMLERWKGSRHLAKKAGVPDYGRVITIFSTHELVRLDRNLRATTLPINVYKTVPVGDWDEPRMKSRLGSENVELLYNIGKALMIGGQTAMDLQRYSVVEIPHIKTVFTIKLERAAKKVFRLANLTDTMAVSRPCRICGKPFVPKSITHMMCPTCYFQRLRSTGIPQPIPAPIPNPTPEQTNADRVKRWLTT